MNAQAALESDTLRKAVYGAVVGLVGFGILYGGFTLLGPINMTVYTFLFVLGFGIVPSLIGILGKSVPFSGSLGKGHIVLMQFAFGNGYLVEFDDKYDWLPGTPDAYWYDGKLHEFDGKENRSVLGWQPFGIIRHKDENAYADVREDAVISKDRTSADGGQLVQGNVEQVPPPDDSGLDGTWVIDLKRVYSRGVKKFGDIELIEKAEEVIERGQVSGSLMSGWRPIIATAMGIVLGLITGLMVL